MGKCSTSMGKATLNKAKCHHNLMKLYQNNATNMQAKAKITTPNMHGKAKMNNVCGPKMNQQHQPKMKMNNVCGPKSHHVCGPKCSMIYFSTCKVPTLAPKPYPYRDNYFGL